MIISLFWSPLQHLVPCAHHSVRGAVNELRRVSEKLCFCFRVFCIFNVDELDP